MTDWKSTTMAHWELIDTMAAKRFGVGPLAEEAALFVIEALQEDDWRRVRSFRKTAKFTTFLRSIVYRLLEDFSRHKFGRRQAPLWLRRLGGVWLRLYVALCLERLSIVEAVARCAPGHTPDGETDMEAVACHIKEKITGCGSHQGLEVPLNENASAETHGDDTPETTLDHQQRRRLLEAIFLHLVEGKRGAEEALDALLDVPFELSGEEKLSLRMRFVDDYSVSRMAEMLRMSRHQINGRLRRLLKRLRAVLETSGLADEVVDQLREK